jgi:hypothetical protein
VVLYPCLLIFHFALKNNILSSETNNQDEWQFACEAVDPFGSTTEKYYSTIVEIINEPPSTPLVLTPTNGLYDGREGYDGTQYYYSQPIDYLAVNCTGSIDIELDTICYNIIYSTPTTNGTVTECDSDGYYLWDIRFLGDESSVDLSCRAFDGESYSSYYNPSGTFDVDSNYPSISATYTTTNNVSYNTTLNFSATIGLGETHPNVIKFRWNNGTSWIDEGYFSYIANQSFSFQYNNQLIPKDTIIMYDWYGNDTLGHINGLYRPCVNGGRGYGNIYSGCINYPYFDIEDTPSTPITILTTDVTDVGVGERFCGVPSGAIDIDVADTVEYFVRIVNLNTSEEVVSYKTGTYNNNVNCYVITDAESHDTFEIYSYAGTKTTYASDEFNPSGMEYVISSPATILNVTITANNTRPEVTIISPLNDAYKFETFNLKIIKYINYIVNNVYVFK